MRAPDSMSVALGFSLKPPFDMGWMDDFDEVDYQMKIKFLQPISNGRFVEKLMTPVQLPRR